MPAMRDGDFCLPDSTAIVHYLEAKHPEPVLIPRDPELLGKTIWFEEFADTIMTACGAKMFFNRIVAPRFMGRPGDLDAADAAERDELPPIMDYLERTVPDSGFLVGDGLTLADIAVASPFANLRHMNVELDPAHYPRTLAYVGRILDRPSFRGWVERETAMLERIPA
jgi:glutathione S-transferase